MSEQDQHALQNVEQPHACRRLGDFCGARHWVRVTRVVDGDTFDGLLMRAGEPHSARFRLKGIDAPETRPRRANPNRDAIRAAGYAAKAHLQALTDESPSKVIECQLFQTGSFGRILCCADVANQTVSWNERMVNDGYAVPYAQRKHPWEERQAIMLNNRSDAKNNVSATGAQTTQQDSALSGAIVNDSSFN